ncbi:MAG: glycosyltransferase family 4 protein [candidate division KSB1 bacterium]|nr:glycosyltransferase family 4 protein [candidate division KSB1 bacterium]MDZ7385006.1 glycosyltransferase family 4 protein [candidate division KSB1 bacterium]
MSEPPGALRVLQVCSSPSWGGMEMQVATFSALLRRRGHEVSVACARGTPLYRELTRLGFAPHHFRPRGYLDPAAIVRLAQLLRAQHVQVIHCHYSRDLWTVVPAARLAGRVPTVLIKHVGTMRPKRDPAHRWLYGHVAQVWAISRVIRENLIATHPIAPERVAVVHQGVDLARFRVPPQERARVRGQFGFAENALVVGTIGRLEPGKGHLEFLHMAAEVARQVPQSVFLVVGGTTRGEEFRAEPIYRLAAELNLGPRLVFAGFRQDIPSVLAAMDVFAFPSRAEAFGLVVIEAMAAGVPVISTASDGVLDIVVDGESGLLVPPQDVASLTKAVVRLLTDAELRHRLGRAGRQRVKRLFTVERMAAQVEMLSRGLLGPRQA